MIIDLFTNLEDFSSYEKQDVVFVPWLLRDDVLGSPGDPPMMCEFAYTTDVEGLDHWWFREDWTDAVLEEMSLVNFVTLHILNVEPQNSYWEQGRLEWQAKNNHLCPTPTEFEEIVNKYE